MASPSGTERVMGANDLIVSKTDRKGHITYANDVFLKISGFSRNELMGKPHAVVRDPAMPRAIFRLLWNHLGQGREVFAYIVNRTKGGDHYWVLAHATPSRDETGAIVGFHSSRRKPNPAAIAAIQELHALLLNEEARHSDKLAGTAASSKLLNDFLAAKGMEYDEYVLSI